MNIELMKQRRKELEMTQQDLADECGLSKNTIYNYENGRFEPTNENLEVLAKVLKVSIFSLLNEPTIQEIEENFSDTIYNMKLNLVGELLYSLAKDKKFPNFKQEEPEELLKDKRLVELLDFISDYLDCRLYYSSKFDKLIVRDNSNKNMYMLDVINIIFLVKSLLLSIDTFLDTIKINSSEVYGLDESLLFSYEKEFLEKREAETKKKIQELMNNKEGGSDE